MNFFARYRLWFHTLVCAAVVLLLCSLYHSVSDSYFSLVLLNRALADTAVILIALSFALSGLSFFVQSLRRFVPYRRHLGVIGFMFALFHGTVTIFFLANLFPFPLYFLSQPLPFIFSSLAILIYTMMTIVSHFGIPQKIGGLMWRRLLRVGYIGIALSILHFGILQFSSWTDWLLHPFSALPPASFIMLILSIATIVLRVVLHTALQHKPVQKNI